ncbi:MAG: bifunctional riboflavin kinase/FAD synthetase [Chloroflexi bacterium]|nr:MAG: bifunctional riboflavin kinase/FMN adenylyltransferase [Phototrophicales bacterium]RMF78145.1 MAG: bifunctional riboflavin kinase/FAD synthetase [Chloroflexota bacterium]
MTHIYHLTKVQLDHPSMVTIGVFDGVHKGHQHLITRLVKRAHDTGRLAVVLTFFPHPDLVLRGLKGRYYLTSAEQKAALLHELGVDHVVTHPFDESVRQIRAADFVDLLLKHLNLDVLCVGTDFAMGYKREGNVDFLREQAAGKNFTVEVVDLVQNNDSKVSSSAIRAALLDGDVEQASKWLGRSYALSGEVIHGDHRGRSIGFPTANIALWDEQVIPANGVYACWARLGDARYMAMTNVGVRPTFDGERITVEAHLLDFDAEIYGQQLEISFETRLRAEKRFNGVDELVAQIKADVEAGRAYLSQLV